MICRYPVELDFPVNGKHRIIYVPCNKCAWCLRRIRNEWFVRFFEESKNHYFTRFVTLDYRDEDLPIKFNEETGEIIPTVSLRDVQLYHKRLRKDYDFRFFLSSEYGKKHGRPHYHAIYWSDERIPFLDYWKHGDEGADLPAKAASFKYVTKYILKGAYVPVGADPLFHTMSRRPGIGVGFLETMNENTTFYRYYNKKMRLPAYYQRKFMDSLPDELRSSISESKIDYLSSQGKYSSFVDSFVKNAPEDQSIDEWINDLYKKDIRKQYLINSK